MVIVETSVFTRHLQALLADDDYRKLQVALAHRPRAGAVIPGSGGLRKIRWGTQERGKRGSVRVIYYWAVKQERLLMLMVYAKNERTDLTADQLKTLRQIVEAEYP